MPDLSSRLVYNLRYAVAVAVAALWSDVFTVKGRKRVLVGLRFFTGLARGRGIKVSAELQQTRLEACRTCPIYYAPLQTCGSPLGPDPELGCYCFMPSKSEWEQARCWLDEEQIADGEAGWESAIARNTPCHKP